MADADPQETSTGADAGTAGPGLDVAPLQSGTGALAAASAEAVTVSQCSPSALQCQCQCRHASGTYAAHFKRRGQQAFAKCYYEFVCGAIHANLRDFDKKKRQSCPR